MCSLEWSIEFKAIQTDAKGGIGILHSLNYLERSSSEKPQRSASCLIRAPNHNSRSNLIVLLFCSVETVSMVLISFILMVFYGNWSRLVAPTGWKKCTKRFGGMHVLVFLPLIFNNHLEKSGRVTSPDRSICHLLETIQSNTVIVTLTEIDAFQTGLYWQKFSLTAMLDLQGKAARLGLVFSLSLS